MLLISGPLYAESTNCVWIIYCESPQCTCLVPRTDCEIVHGRRVFCRVSLHLVMT